MIIIILAIAAVFIDFAPPQFCREVEHQCQHKTKHKQEKKKHHKMVGLWINTPSPLLLLLLLSGKVDHQQKEEKKIIPPTFIMPTNSMGYKKTSTHEA